MLEPLGLGRTGLGPIGPARDRVLRRSVLRSHGHDRARPGRSEAPTAATAGCGRRSPTWPARGDFLATGRDGVLPGERVDEMARVRSMIDEARWTLGWGLGLGLYRRGERVYVGHGGAMPGFLAALGVDRTERTGRPCCSARARAPYPDTLAMDLSRDRARRACVACPSPGARRRRARGRRAGPRKLVDGKHRGRSRPGVAAGSGSRRSPYPAGRKVSFFAREERRPVAGASRVVSAGEAAPRAQDGDRRRREALVATYPLTGTPAAFGASAWRSARAVAGHEERGRRR